MLRALLKPSTGGPICRGTSLIHLTKVGSIGGIAAVLYTKLTNFTLPQTPNLN